MDIYYKKTDGRCKICGQETSRVIDFPSLPITDLLFSEPTSLGTIDQGLDICYVCGHGQLSAVASMEVLYGDKYALRTSEGTGPKKINDQFLRFIDRVAKEKFLNIIEVGCNDCYLLNMLRYKGENLIGIDPVLKDRENEFSDDQLTIIGNFVENVALDQYKNVLFVSSHMIEHIEDPRKMLKIMLETSDDDSLFIFQFPGFDTIIQDCRFDQVYSHHLHYFSLFSFSYLLAELGCEIIEWEVDPHYFGTLTVAFKKIGSRSEVARLDVKGLGLNVVDSKTGSKISSKSSVTKSRSDVKGTKINSEMVLDSYRLFKMQMEQTALQIERFRNIPKCAYGAGLQLPVLTYHLENDLSFFKYIFDDDHNKAACYFPNITVPISGTDGDQIKDSVVLITAANFSRQILSRLIPLEPKRIILPYHSIV